MSSDRCLIWRHDDRVYDEIERKRNSNIPEREWRHRRSRHLCSTTEGKRFEKRLTHIHGMFARSVRSIDRAFVARREDDVGHFERDRRLLVTLFRLSNIIIIIIVVVVEPSSFEQQQIMCYGTTDLVRDERVQCVRHVDVTVAHEAVGQKAIPCHTQTAPNLRQQQDGAFVSLLHFFQHIFVEMLKVLIGPVFQHD
jgi:hypothetical protein